MINNFISNLKRGIIRYTSNLDPSIIDGSASYEHVLRQPVYLVARVRGLPALVTQPEEKSPYLHLPSYASSLWSLSVSL